MRRYVWCGIAGILAIMLSSSAVLAEESTEADVLAQDAGEVLPETTLIYEAEDIQCLN